MKKFGLLTTLLISGLLLTGCNTNEQKIIEQNSSILTWGFSVRQDIEEVVNEEVEDDNNVIPQNSPLVEEYVIHTWCNKYINNEFWFQIDLSDWTSSCKITYSDFDYPYIVLSSLPLNDYWWFEWWGDFETITIIAKDEEIKDKDPLFNYDEVFAENNKYKFYRVWWSASPSFYYTYFPLGYNDFICEWVHKDNDWNLVDNNWCYCSEDNSYWKSINIDMPNPARNIWCVTQALIRESFSVFDI